MSTRVNQVKAARKPQTACEICKVEINAGDPYLWYKHRYGFKHVRCMKPSCRPNARDLESNSKRASHAEAVDAVENARNAENPPDAAHYLREAISAVESIVGELQDSLDAWSGTNLENGSQYESFDMTRDALESWKDDAENVADDLEGMDAEPDAPGEEPDDPDEPVRSDFDDENAYAEALSDYDEQRTERDEWETANAAYEEYEQTFKDKLDEIDDVPDLDF